MKPSSAQTIVRLDKWCWAARLFRTRSLATTAIERGRVRVDGESVKPARTVRVGDRLAVVRGEEVLELLVRAIDDVRGSAARAQLLYEETEASRTQRLERAARRRLMPEPSAARKGRPTKREARALRSLREA
jgi:ribosome-associated heat shock protein Hsp15